MANFQFPAQTGGTAEQLPVQNVQMDPTTLAQFQQFQAQQAAAAPQYQPVIQQPVAAPAAPQAPVNYDAILAQLMATNQNQGQQPTLQEVQDQLKGIHEAVAKRVENPLELARFADAMIQEKRGANSEAAKYRRQYEETQARLEALEREKQEAEMTAVERERSRNEALQRQMSQIETERQNALARQYEAEVKLKLTNSGCNQPDYMLYRLKDHIQNLEDSEIKSLDLDRWIANERQLAPNFFGPTQAQVRQEAAAPLGGAMQAPVYQTPQVPVANHGIQQVYTPEVQERLTQSIATQPMVTNMQQANMNPQLQQQQMTVQMMQAMAAQQQLQAQAAQQQAAALNPQYAAALQQAAQRPMAQTGAPPIPLMAAPVQQITRIADVSKNANDFADRDASYAAFKATNGM